MPKLKELDAWFLRRQEDGSMLRTQELKDADGIIFLCPLCFKKNGGSRGTHSVICWFVGRVPDDADPKPGRWNPQGTSLNDLTFVGPGAVSVLMTNPDGCGWHGFVRDGAAD